MHSTLLTCIQLFGIGLSFGIAGPCIIGCTPMIIAYLSGKQAGRGVTISDIIIFLSGRFTAYLALGWLAGISGALLKRWSNFFPKALLHSFAGVFIIMLGVLIWTAKDPSSNTCRCMNNKKINFGGLFAAGVFAGIFPCAPLLALLFEIALMSETALNGIFYAMCFGLGTFISGFIVIGCLAGVLIWLPKGLLKSQKWKMIFRAVYSALFILFGVWIILRA